MSNSTQGPSQKPTAPPRRKYEPPAISDEETFERQVFCACNKFPSQLACMRNPPVSTS